MSQKLAEENLIRSYLIGKLPENEQDELETRLLTDPEFFETSLIIEGELLDDYVMGLLSKPDRMSLESGLLISAQQQRRIQLIRLLWVKSKALVSAKKQSSNLLSLWSRYFRSHRSGSYQAVRWEA
ncbi:MAG TPA: hypothetical protein VN643_11355 [Pyrinomonadaceae bacterium]|nr:hypothetical protein [Pyrinomonadaceae bacterium]